MKGTLVLSMQDIIITGQRNMLFPETVQAISIVLEGYKNKLFDLNSI